MDLRTEICSRDLKDRNWRCNNNNNDNKDLLYPDGGVKMLVLIYQTVPFLIYQTTPPRIPYDNNCQLSTWKLHVFYLVMITAGAEVYDALWSATCPAYVDTELWETVHVACRRWTPDLTHRNPWVQTMSPSSLCAPVWPHHALRNGHQATGIVVTFAFVKMCRNAWDKLLMSESRRIYVKWVIHTCVKLGNVRF